MESNSNWGGKRPGSGRKSYTKMKNDVKVRLSDQSKDLLDEYVDGLGISRSQLVDLLLFKYLDPYNKDFIFCSQCKRPQLFVPAVNLPEGESDCICSHCGAEFKAEF